MSKQLAMAALSAATLWLAVGCAQDAAPDGDARTATGAAQVADTAPCPEPAYLAMPAGIELDQPFLVASDRVYETDAGGERRRTWLEIQEGDPLQVAEGVVTGLLAEGFERVETRERDDDITRLAVHKRGVGRINISATRELGARPSHPRSVGQVGFDWPVAGPDEGPDAGPDEDSAAEAADTAAAPPQD